MAVFSFLCIHFTYEVFAIIAKQMNDIQYTTISWLVTGKQLVLEKQNM